MFLKGLRTFALGLIFLYLQILVMPAVAIWNVIPLILLPWLIYVVWSRPPEIALVVSFLVGLMYDTLNPATFGMHALLFCLLALLINLLRIPFEQDSLVAKLIAIGTSNLVFALLSLLGNGISWGFGGSIYSLNALAFLYNLVFSLVIFFAMQLISKLRIIVVND